MDRGHEYLFRPSGKIIGLSIAASSSRSAIVRAWASVSRAAPCT